jgi:putative ATP-dependent endonuclease of OLD family
LDEKFNEIVGLLDKVEGFSQFKKDFVKFFSEMQAETALKMSVDFKPFTPSNYFKTMQILATDPRQGEAELDLEELGEGTRNLILLSLLRSYAANLRKTGEEPSGILALEEPEIYMHPQAQRNLHRILREIANNGIQVIISTHSTSFVESEYFDSIGLVRKVLDPEVATRQCSDLTLVTKDELVQHCKKTGVPTGKTSTENIREYYKSTSNYRLNEAFFARFVILVEGESEELALPEYFRAAGLDCDMKGVSIIPVQGKNQLPKYWRLFSAFRIPLLVMFDNDDDGTGAKRSSNKNLCSCFGVPLDSVLHASDWTILKSTNHPQTPLLIAKQDFETTVRIDYEKHRKEGQPSWEQLLAEAKQIVRPTSDDQGKGLIARYIARKLVSGSPAYYPSFIASTVTLIHEALGFKNHKH